MNKKLLIVMMMLMAFGATSNASNHPIGKTVTTAPHDEGCWLVALDKDDNEIWTEIDYYSTPPISFDLCHYTNWNYYDQTGTRYVRTYFVIDGERYIADGFDPDVWDGDYSLEQSNEYMHWNTGTYYSIYFYDDYVYIEGQLPSGYWEDYIVLTDKDGNEIVYGCGMGGHPDIALDMATYGSDVFFHFRRDYPFYKSYSYYGAENDGVTATPGVPFANKLYNSTNNFSVPAGYHYNIGIFGDNGNNYLYLLQGDPIQEGNLVKKGDVDGDGNVSIADVTTLIDMLLSGDTAGNEAADCDGDGQISIADVTTLIDYLLSGSW